MLPLSDKAGSNFPSDLCMPTAMQTLTIQVRSTKKTKQGQSRIHHLGETVTYQDMHEYECEVNLSIRVRIFIYIYIQIYI